jgi:hypothetical protein
MNHNPSSRQPVPKPTMRVKEPRPLRSRPNPVDARAKQQTFARDDYLCQWCRVPGGHLDPHHRLRRSQGGRDVELHMVSVHRLCHSYIHDHPAEAAERGFLVTSEDELIWGWR